MKRFGVGVLGTGIMGRRMVGASPRHDQFQVFTVRDAHPNAERHEATEFAGVRRADGLQDLVLDPFVGIVYSVSPPVFHWKGVQAAGTGKHAGLCEKPLALGVADAMATTHGMTGAPRAARGTGLKRVLFGGLMTCAINLSSAAEPVAAPALQPLPVGDWNFRALLDGKAIGQHRFTVNGQGDDREVTSEANFSVKFLGITAYRYHHQATEHWRGGCLSGLAASTDDDGKASSVRAEVRGDTFTVQASSGSQSLKGCVMSFAYWNPAILSRTRLLNVQTGQLETVQIQRVGTGSIEVRGKTVPATGYRISGPAQPIDLWYSAQEEWIGLDSSVSGGRKLSYRLY